VHHLQRGQAAQPRQEWDRGVKSSIRSALKDRQGKLILQRGKLDREPVQRFGHIAEGVHFRQWISIS